MTLSTNVICLREIEAGRDAAHAIVIEEIENAFELEEAEQVEERRLLEESEDIAELEEEFTGNESDNEE